MSGGSVVARTQAAPASSGSQTVVQHIDQTPSATLRLRGVAPNERRHIQWREDVVDNEGMGKKSSKVCCIYHKPHEPDDSDSDSSSSGSDSDDEPDLSRAQKAAGSKKNGRGRKHDHSGDKGKDRAPSPNAYERQPKHAKASGGCPALPVYSSPRP